MIHRVLPRPYTFFVHERRYGNDGSSFARRTASDQDLPSLLRLHLQYLLASAAARPHVVYAIITASSTLRYNRARVTCLPLSQS